MRLCRNAPSRAAYFAFGSIRQPCRAMFSGCALRACARPARLCSPCLACLPAGKAGASIRRAFFRGDPVQKRGCIFAKSHSSGEEWGAVNKRNRRDKAQKMNFSRKHALFSQPAAESRQMRENAPYCQKKLAAAKQKDSVIRSDRGAQCASNEYGQAICLREIRQSLNGDGGR